MEGFCRGCLIKYDDPVDLLHYSEKNRRLYVYSTGLQVKRNDIISFLLCKDCYMNMKLACKFKKQCRNSDKRLQDFLSLKESGECSDFCTFLKNNDDSLLFKFPLNGNSTPLQKFKDDDNESTCTSISNFMPDILHTNEIPDTEARIIREVIQEEADVLDESLDSHWLNDDISIDTNFKLDFSFSPFSSPRLGNNENLDSPKKVLKQPASIENDQIIGDESFMAAKKIMLESNIGDNPENSTGSINMFKALSCEIDLDTVVEGTDNDDTLKNISPIGANFYVENGKVDPDQSCIQIVETMEKKDCINRNLEKALENTENNEFSLDDILATPPICPGGSGPSTPTIANIIFGKQITDENSNSEQQKAGHCIENFQYIEGSEADVLEDFFNKETGEYVHDNKAKIEPEVFVEETYDRNIPDDFKLLGKTKYDLSDFSCKICDKTFCNVKALKIHFTKYHKFKIVGPATAKIKYKEVICDYCGLTFNYINNLSRHIRTHLKKPELVKCDKCGIEFSGKDKLKMHMNVHTRKAPLKISQKKHVCEICGRAISTKQNLLTHMRRHTRTYSHECKTCGRRFYRKTDLADHMRLHDRERPFSCSVCSKRFCRRDVLSKHIRRHLDERLHKCSFCGASFLDYRDVKYHMEKSKTCISKRPKTVEEQREEDENVENTCMVTEEIKAVITPGEIKSVENIELPTVEDLGLPDLSFIIEEMEDKAKEANFAKQNVMLLEI